MTCPPRSRPPDEQLSGFRAARTAGDRTASGSGWSIPAPRAAESGVVAQPRPGRLDGPPGRALTHRDLQLVRDLADGRSVAQVALALAVSRNTARTRIRRVEGKLAVRGRAQIVAAARTAGLI
jgi:DNA-binding CsgD family transcriptional regulator